MTMKTSLTGLIIFVLLSLTDAATDTGGSSLLRRVAAAEPAAEPDSESSSDGDEEKVDQFECTLKAKDQSTCDSTKDDQGSSCVWCSVASIGVCVTEEIAEQMKARIPNIDCDDNKSTDDDKTATDDKIAPTDDDATPNDDSVPSDYWKCLTKYKNQGNCTSSGCAWCKTDGGYGICMDKETAEAKSDSDWYKNCSMPKFESEEEEEEDDDLLKVRLSDPTDPSCVIATASGDESTCKQTKDAVGNSCDWCSFNGFNFCVNDDQAQIVEQIGASCGESEFEFESDKFDDDDNRNTSENENKNEAEAENLSDPNDLTCIEATVGGDESSCKGTMDTDSKPCEWCSFNGFNFCLNVDQAQIAEQIGADCGDGVVDDADFSLIASSTQ